jgi:hypothetical protein
VARPAFIVPPAAPTAAATAAAAVLPAHPLLYRSPVGRRLVSFKFAAAPGGKGNAQRTPL